MHFLVDECTGPKVSKWLMSKGHDVYSVFDQARGISDQEVLKIAIEEKRIIVTNDKDFGEMVYRNKMPHSGIILLRLVDERAEMKVSVLSQFLKSYQNMLQGAFVVVSEEQVRFATRQ